MIRKQLDHTQVLQILPDRKPDSHKGDYGHILLLCGSRGYTGAPELAAMGALRSGAGLVYLGVPECIYTIEATKLTEPIVIPLVSQGDTISDKAISQICKLLPKMDAVLFGCGVGQSAGSLAVLEAIMEFCQCPLVLDADGINLLSRHMDLLRGRKHPTILTPHHGEFARLKEFSPETREADAVSFAKEMNCILLLKGHESLITDGQICYHNHTGNPGMAVGGNGDMLAGMITAFLGQGLEPLESAAVAAWLHGAAGDLCAKEIGQYGMLPSDMLTVLPRLLK